MLDVMQESLDYTAGYRKIIILRIIHSSINIEYS